MGYQIPFKDVLLEGWIGWDGNGISDIPAKDVTLKDGTHGGILLSSEGVSVYSAPTDKLYEEEGEFFLAHAKNEDFYYELEGHLSTEDMKEAFLVYNKYMEREKSYQS